MPAKKRARRSPESDSDALKTFRILFWNARKSHQFKRKQACAEAPEHHKALAFAEQRGWPWAKTLLTALLLAYQDEGQQALGVLSDLKVPDAFLGEHYFTLGVIHHALKDFDTAIEYYRKALDIPGYDKPGQTWNSIGIAYKEKKDFETAIDCYRKALDSPNYDTPGPSWNNMGIAYDEKKNFDAAIDCYRRALDSPNYDTPGHAWNNMGVAYNGKREFEAAIDCYRKAIDSPGYNPSNAWNNMGIAYSRKKDFEAAIGCYREAIDTPNNDLVQQHRLSLATALINAGRAKEAKTEIEQVLGETDRNGQHARARILLSTIKSAERGFAPDPDEEALTAPTPPSLEGSPEERMKQALMDRKTRYKEYYDNWSSEAVPDGLSILRGWSSSVTLLEGAQDCQWSGGGYFLKWRGKGLVIDPGFDFLDNFHQAGFHVMDIDAIVVSHNHPDHNADLNTLDNLCHEIAKVADPTPKFLFAMDEDTGSRFEDDNQEHRGSPYKFTRFDHENLRWLESPNLPFIIEHFPVKHGPGELRANGLRFRLKSEDGSHALIVGYTGDGEYTNDLAENLRGVDLLIAHVSQPDTQEFNDPSHLKKIHLGYNGAIRLIKEVKPKLTLIGEFWAGLADLRLDLIAGIRLRSGIDAILPACHGLHLSLPRLEIPCSSCHQLIPPGQIRIAPPLKEFGLLGYLCNRCIL